MKEDGTSILQAVKLAQLFARDEQRSSESTRDVSSRGAGMTKKLR
jgi:hypothetical protein